jgi:DNA-binding CsgD family transcriptional regulator
VLLGRTAERAVLDDLVAGATEARSGVLVLRGEPGVGKTALLDDIASRRGPLRLIRAAAIESEVELPYAGLHQLLYPLLDHFDRLPPPQAQALRGAFGLEPGRGEDRFVVAVAVLSLLADVAGGTGLLCLIDDAQWLDQASSAALGFAARRLHAEGVALVFALRDGADRWLDTANLPTLALRGLDAEAATSLLASRAPQLPAAVVDALVAGTGGNPLALLELPSALQPDQLSGQAPLPDPLPVGRTVEDHFVAAAGRLPEPARRLLLLAAAEDAGDLSLLLRAAAELHLGPEALDDAERSGLLHIRHGRIAFRHPLVRSAVYQRAPFNARRSAHLALAAALDGEPRSDRRYWHLAAAAVGPDPELAAHLEAEARRISDQSGPAAAAAAWERSASLTPPGPQRADRLVAAADAAWDAGSPLRALALLDRAESPRSPAAADRLRGLIELRCGEPATAYQLLVKSATDAAADDPHAALESLVMAGEAASFSGDAAQTVEIGRLAAGMPTDTHPDDRMTVLMLAGIAAAMSGEWESAATQLRSVVDAGSAVATPVALLRAGRAAFYLGDEDAARSLHARTVATARQLGSVGALPLALDRLAFSDCLAGRLNDAAIAADEGQRLAAEIGHYETRAHHLVTLILVAGWRGDEEACRGHAAEALALAAERRIVLVSSAVSWGLGLLELGSGQAARALDRLTELVRGPGHPAVQVWAIPDLVEAASRAHQPDAALRPLAQFERWAQRNGTAWARAVALRCRAQVSTNSDALAHLERAVALHAGATRPLEYARTRLVYGEALRRDRRRSAARTHLRAAAEQFDRAGARLWARRAAAELRATGETIGASGATSIDVLTPQELQIARMAAEGVSNPTIAEHLFLSRRTVEYHLRKVFIKLGVASRTELVRVDLT